MKVRTTVVSLVLCFVVVRLCSAQDMNIGKWKLNEAKSKISQGAPKNTTVVYEAAGEYVKVTIDGVGGDGKPTHNEWTGKYDGKDYSVIGDPTSDARSFTKIDDHTLGFNGKKGGETTTSGRMELPQTAKVGQLRQAELMQQAKRSTP